MSPENVPASETARDHFIKRAAKYDQSSRWVEDTALIEKIREQADAGPEACVLDLAIGTGKIAQAFHGRVQQVVGVDICQEMVAQARPHADKIVLTSAEKLPFENDTFDVCVCRQGLQFMELSAVLAQIHRVLKPGGRVVLAHLTAYGEEDKDETFLIQKLRNPSRKNFFMPDDFSRLLRGQGFKAIQSSEYLTRESIDQWTDHGAIGEDARLKIRAVYTNASEAFKARHDVQWKEDDIWDTMKMVLVKAVK
ncbi:MAG: class I SAM-dependent methyltransferase [Candidatus Omnitrophota bacterium]